jgi:hypothetical protein
LFSFFLSSLDLFSSADVIGKKNYGHVVAIPPLPHFGPSCELVLPLTTIVASFLPSLRARTCLDRRHFAHNSEHINRFSGAIVTRQTWEPKSR